MKDRIKLIRKEANLTQEKFAQRLGLKRNTIATYETGKGEPMDSIIVLICREFNVNENWLRTGEGEPFLPEDRETEILRLAKKLLTEPDDSFKNAIITTLLETTPEEWEVIENMAERIIQNKKKKE